MSYYLCVLDFEATCWEDPTRKPEMEIIEFPSVLYKIDYKSNPTFISEFAKYVKPTKNPILSEFCTNLTGIKQETVDVAETIDVVYQQHKHWLSEHVPDNEKLIFATCGKWDLMTMLPREITNKGLKSDRRYSKYINVKDEFENFYSRKAGSMDEMLKKVNLQLEGRLHSGIDDTKNIARVLLKMFEAGYNIKKFNVLTVKE